ncbi:hypothetical protein RHMOL_Rhmol09G0076100 [Rhododendron molle]|uniref:Uncharacterized protein n=1 Tax=Rhododendron molle TaxID=49168 RepID=A0ACC0MAY3_RHOML|nr:hypothetical protein RHMOL_Rhmol09G0076100 [Rhododendron molle]
MTRVGKMNAGHVIRVIRILSFSFVYAFRERSERERKEAIPERTPRSNIEDLKKKDRSNQRSHIRMCPKGLKAGDLLVFLSQDFRLNDGEDEDDIDYDDE